MVIILVLWMLVLLILMVASWSRSVHTESLLGAQIMRRAQAESLAGAGVMIGIDRLLRSRAVNRAISLHGRMREYTVDGHRVRIGIRSERGRIDLNMANRSMIRQLLVNAVGDESKATSLADAILDWRDSDDKRRKFGAEDADYDRTLFPHGAKDRHFSDVEELLAVKGMTMEIYQNIQASVTVHSYSAKLDPSAASLGVLESIPGMDGEAVARARQILARSSETSGNAIPNPSFTDVGDSNIFSIASIVETQGVRVRILAVVALPVNPKSESELFWILSWKAAPGIPASDKGEQFDA